MIPSNLLKAQLDLQSHRLWLASFRFGARQLDRRPGGRRASISEYRGLHSFPAKRYALPTHAQTQQRYASTVIRRTGSRKLKSETADEGTLQLRELRQAVQDVDIGRLVQLYAAIKDKSIVRPNDARIIAQCLHYSSRTAKRLVDAQARRENREALVAFAETLVKDVMRGTLAPHCQAHVHILGFFKESGVRDAGIRFWKWLEGQDELHVNPDVYGAAIELLAVNGSPLAEMEDLYQKALLRFPGTFLAYHLSPEAIVADREQATSIRGIPMALLQGILTARLMHGDAYNAYLAFDTALRLYPDQVPIRFFQLFLEERPLLEAYTVFAMACRAGIAVPTNQFRQLIGALRTSSDLSSVVNHSFAVRSMLSMLYVYVSASGQVSSNVLNELIIATTQFLRLKGVANIDPKNKQKLVEQTMDIIRTCLAICARYGAKPGLTAFNSMITNLGGFGHSKQVVGIALADASSLGLRPNEVTRRSILTAAGTLGDGDFVKKAWQGLVQSRADAGQRPDGTDFHVLVKNAVTSGQLDFARQEFERLKDLLPSTDHHGIVTALEAGDSLHSGLDVPRVDQTGLLNEMQKIRLDLSAIKEKTEHASHTQDLSDASLPMTLLPSPPILPEAEMRKLYDELTTEQQSPSKRSTGSDTAASRAQKEPPPPTADSVEANSKPAISSTNIPFSTLRYENWKSINYLLAEAEASDKAYLEGVDQAIAAGRVPPQRKLGLRLGRNNTVERSFGLSDVTRDGHNIDRDGVKTSDAEIAEGRNRILDLRGCLS